ARTSQRPASATLTAALLHNQGASMIEVFAVCLVLVVLAGFLILPIIALIRTRRLGETLERLDRLEAAFVRLRRAVRDLRSTPLAAEIEEETAPLEAVPVSARAEEVTTPDVPAPPRPRPPRRLVPTPPDAATLESLIGQRVMGWAAVVLLLFATAFF